MKTLLVKAALGIGLLAAAGAYAEAPAGATAECKDGTYYSGTTHKGACRGHQGVKTWLNASTASASSTAAAAASDTGTTAKKTKTSKKAQAAAETAAPAAAATSSSSAAGATALCKDGTYYNGTAHKGACRGHQGVKEWLDTKSSAAAAAPASAPAAAPATAPAATAAPALAPKTAAEHKAPTPASEITQKAGGGPGLVWVNSSSKVYHCQGDEWYGKTKEGSYMSEAAAKAEGDHAARGKECSQ